MHSLLTRRPLPAVLTRCAPVWALVLLAACAAPRGAAQTITFGGDLGFACRTMDVAEPLVLAAPSVPAGSTVIVAVTRDITPNAQPLQVTDSRGSVYATDAQATALSGFWLELFSARLAAPLSAGSIRIGYVPQPGHRVCARAVHVRGLARLAALDQVAVASSSTSVALTHATVGPVTTRHAREFVLGVFGLRVGTMFAVSESGSTILDTTCAGSPGPPCVGMAFKTPTVAGEQSARVLLGPLSQAALALVTYRDAVAKGDFNDDGNTDLIFQSPTTGAARVWMMNGSSRVGGEVPTTPAPGTTINVVGADDFDRDHLTDLVVHIPATGRLYVWAMNGTTRTSALLLTDGGSPVVLSPAWRVEATGDFDRDGTPDLLLRNQLTQDIVIWRLTFGSGVSVTGAIVPSPARAVDANWRIVSAQDYTGDGLPDLLWYNVTTGKIVYWAMDADMVRITGAFATPPNAGDNNWQVVAGGDYGIGANGALGSNDIVWRNATSGRLVIWRMDPATVSRTSGVFTSPDAPDDPLSFTVVGPR